MEEGFHANYGEIKTYLVRILLRNSAQTEGLTGNQKKILYMLLLQKLLLIFFM